ncbi:hypothetical protein J6590_053698 [Homalodisca vitripennis]|nr:hypothetical protein J6590_053698 [Homalodisca vitripennis]
MPPRFESGTEMKTDRSGSSGFPDTGEEPDDLLLNDASRAPAADPAATRTVTPDYDLAVPHGYRLATEGFHFKDEINSSTTSSTSYLPFDHSTSKI